MRTSDFYYELPPECIAQQPSEKRDASKLMVIDRITGKIEHKHFFDVLDYLNPGDALIINTTRVLPARLFGNFADTGGKVEILLTRPMKDDDVWEAMTKPAKRLKVGRVVDFGQGLSGEIVQAFDEGLRAIRFMSLNSSVSEDFERLGSLPLPPYIKEKPKDEKRYQTVYADQTGSSAAPTAGLHFTPELLNKAKQKGIIVLPILLHVGLGTFKPVQSERIEDHKMHSEYFEIPGQTKQEIIKVKENGGKIFAVGTTSVRTLESAIDKNGDFLFTKGNTDIFIKPGYKFKAVDALITNFHLPQSTLLMLVSAFYDRKAMLKAYETAVDEDYRFFSFGDAMLIL